MITMLFYALLFLAKVIDNALGTAKTILIQRNRCLLAGAAVVLSDFIYFSLTKRIVSADGSLSILVVALAGGVGCTLVCLVSDRLSKDRMFVNIILSDDISAMQDLRDFLAQHHITNMACDSYTTQQRLEEIFAAFQDGNRPADFTGKSLSVSDIVALKQSGVVSCHYCNPIGYKEIPDFFGLETEREAPQTEKAEKAEAIKPKEPPIPQEIKVRQSAGKAKKPSVIEKLHRFQAEDRARELKAKTMEDYSL